VENLLSKIRLISHLRDCRAWIALACRFLCLSLFAGLLAGGAAFANFSDAGAGPNRSGLPFAIGDFDGDSRPDVASVETGTSDFANSEYWIELQLSAAGWESIRLVAPVGGLRLVARDVNGDASVDLVVSTAWSNRPVAIYLNDGHGLFTHSEPGAYPKAFSKAARIWASVVALTAENVGVPSPQKTGICPQDRELPYERCSARLLTFPGVTYRFGPTMFLHAGRAPPFEFIHS
jgi:hypothetical protein